MTNIYDKIRYIRHKMQYEIYIILSINIIMILIYILKYIIDFKNYNQISIIIIILSLINKYNLLNDQFIIGNKVLMVLMMLIYMIIIISLY